MERPWSSVSSSDQSEGLKSAVIAGFREIVEHHVKLLLRSKGIPLHYKEEVMRVAAKHDEVNAKLVACLAVFECFPFHFTIQELSKYAGITDVAFRLRLRRKDVIRRRIYDALEERWISTPELLSKLLLKPSARMKIYRILEDLESKGLVESFRRGKLRFWRKRYDGGRFDQHYKGDLD